MISSVPIDGVCYKMTVSYGQSNVPIADKTYTVWGESEEELFDHYREIRHLWNYVEKIVILDDSK